MLGQQNKAVVFLEKVFWFYLFLNPIMDIFNGFYINVISNVEILGAYYISTLGITPSLVVRMIFLAAFACYLLLVRDWRALLTAVPIIASLALSMLSERLHTGSVNFFVDVQYMARFCYNIALLMVYTRVLGSRWGYDGKDLIASLNAVAVYTMTILSLAVLLPAIFGVGYNTYADRLGYRGHRGFFYAGNDITAILAVLLPLLIAVEMNKFRTAKEMSAGKPRLVSFNAVAAALSANSLLMIGSKTAFIALAATGACMLIAGICFAWKNNDKRVLIGFLIVVLLTAGVFIILNVISLLQQMGSIRKEYGKVEFNTLVEHSVIANVFDSAKATGDLLQNEGMEMALLSGRQVKLAAQMAEFRDGGIVAWLFGIGRGSQAYVIEMDLFEVICYYGLFGFAAMLWLYVRVAVQFVIGLFRKFSLTAFALLLGIGMTAGYMIIAGHVLFSVTSGFYLAYAIVYSRVLFADKAEDVLLWKKTKPSAS